ncbi:hypothetical protein LCGC14_0802640 [marine sediment metagenome]|uniref:Transposase DDE domain-containing protein n=1 Tax=marine sediment metagenome TaxID=412755 RepID=A0A0F9S959_9ZZZZ
MKKTPHLRIILDMDSLESPVHGEQEGSAYNGHYGFIAIGMEFFLEYRTKQFF